MSPEDLPLVGRDVEMARLDAALARAADGRGGAVLLAGEAGIGKSRLAREARDRAVAREMIVLWGGAHLDTVELSYAPIHEAYGRCLRGLGDKARGRLTGGLPDLSRLFGELTGRAPPAIADPALERTRLFDAVAQLTERLAADAPVLLVIDDLHWADPATIGVLQHLGRVASGRRVLTLATVRGALDGLTGAAAGLLAQWRRLGADEIVVGPLADAAIDALLAARLGGPAPEDVVARIRGHVAGVPLFAELLVRSMIDGRHLIPAGGRWIAAGALPAEPPPAVRDLIAARLDRLAGLDRRIMDVLGVAGGQIEHGALTAALDVPDDELLAAFVRMRRAGVVIEDGQGGYRAGHPLLAEVARHELPAEARRRLHLALARHLEAGGAVDLDELARHLRGAGRDADPQRTLDVQLAAAARALDRHANEQAVTHLAGALALIRGGLRPELTGDVLDRLGEAWRRAGRLAAASAAWREALELSGDAEARAGLHRRIALVAWDQGLGADALASLAAAERALGQVSSPQRIAILQVRVTIAERVGDLTALAAAAAELASIAVTAPVAAPASIAAAARLALAEHRLDDAWRLALELEAAATSVGDLAVLRACELAATIAMERMSTAEVRPRVELAGQLARRLGEPASQLRATGIEATAAFHDGCLDECQRAATAALELSERFDIPRGRSRLQALRGCAAAWRGRYDEAGADLAAAEHAIATAAADRWVPPTVALLAATIAVLRGDGGLAARWREVLLDPADQWAIRCVFAGELAVGRGAHDEAAAIASRLEAAQAPAVVGLGTWLRARIDLAGGARERAIVQLRAVTAALDGVTAVFHARALIELSELVDGDEAIAAATAATAACERMGSARLADRARARLRALGVRAAASGARAGELSARQLEVARLYAEGLSSAEVAARLSISTHTAATHLQAIYRRLGVSSRAALTRWLFENELA